MSKLFSKLWNDDQGAVISTELILVIGILIFGIIPGLVALRNSIIANLATTGNILSRVTPSFTFSGFSIHNGGGGSTIALVQGFAVTITGVSVLAGSQVTPVNAGSIIIVPPAP